MNKGDHSDGVSGAVVLAWARLLRAHRAALARVEQALKAQALPPLGWYDALLELDRAPGGLRPMDLEARMLLPQYGLSRLLDRLERAGLVRREPCPEDGRGQVAMITDEGRELRRRMWPVYAAAIDDAIGTRLDEAQAAVLAGLLGRIAGDR